MAIALLLFILVPIIEIAVFIQVGGLLGLWPTLLIVLLTAVIGVNLLKQQGIRAWTDIQLTIAQGKMPAVEMAAAAQLLFAGGLLLTPGFVTDIVGFTLMVPEVRRMLARLLLKKWQSKIHVVTTRAPFESSFDQQNSFRTTQPNSQPSPDRSTSRIVEGEFEDKTDN